MRLPVRIDFDGPHEKYPDQVAITVRRPDTGEPIGSVLFPVLYLDGLIHGEGGCSTMIDLDFDLAVLGQEVAILMQRGPRTVWCEGRNGNHTLRI